MRTYIILTSYLLLLVANTHAQKIKYKDIYVWLANKQYKEAEPFLKKYLKENDDNPNAFLYMGFVFEQKIIKNDVLSEPQQLFSDTDSALYYLEKAYTTITEKELRKNDEYYEVYRRRDLRTGEYGVKLSDVHFDIEKRQQAIRERIDKAKLIRYYFALSDSLYKKSQQLFITICENYPTEKKLLLRSTEKTIQTLEHLAIRFDSCIHAFEIYKTTLQSWGKSGHNQQITMISIKDYEKDGRGVADFMQNELHLWDYKQFAETNKKRIQDEIIPLREQLVGYDIQINRLRVKNEQDSVSVLAALQTIEDESPNSKLMQYDTDPLPISIFSLKLEQLRYRSLLADHKPYRDSANVYLKAALAKKERDCIVTLDSIGRSITTEKIDTQADDYTHFILNTFTSPAVLKSYVRAVQEYAKRERTFKEFEYSFRQKGSQWMLQGTDSIPLFSSPDVNHEFYPLSIVEKKYTTGLRYKDSLTVSGYFYAIPLSHKPDGAVSFAVDKAAYKQSARTSAKALVVSDTSDQLFFTIIYSAQQIKEKIPSTIAKIYRSDGLAWSNNFMLESVPTAATLINGELELTLENGRTMMIDKGGKIK